MVEILYSRKKVPLNVSKNKLVPKNAVPGTGVARSRLWAPALLQRGEALVYAKTSKTNITRPDICRSKDVATS